MNSLSTVFSPRTEYPPHDSLECQRSGHSYLLCGLSSAHQVNHEELAPLQAPIDQGNKTHKGQNHSADIKSQFQTYCCAVAGCIDDISALTRHLHSNLSFRWRNLSFRHHNLGDHERGRRGHDRRGQQMPCINTKTNWNSIPVTISHTWMLLRFSDSTQARPNITHSPKKLISLGIMSCIVSPLCISRRVAHVTARSQCSGDDYTPSHLLEGLTVWNTVGPLSRVAPKQDIKNVHKFLIFNNSLMLSILKWFVCGLIINETVVPCSPVSIDKRCAA